MNRKDFNQLDKADQLWLIVFGLSASALLLLVIIAAILLVRLIRGQ